MFDARCELLTKTNLDDEYRILEAKKRDTGEIIATVVRETETEYENCGRLIDDIKHFTQPLVLDVIQSLWPLIDKTKLKKDSKATSHD